MREKEDTSKKEEPVKLYRSKQNRVIAGVCGGIAEYLNIDPLIIRIGWIATAFFAGAGIIAYIAAIFIIPENSGQESEPRRGLLTSESSKQWGIVLIVVGSILLLGQIGILDYYFFRNFHWQTFLALLLVGYGVYLIVNTKSHSDADAKKEEAPRKNEKSFYRVAEGKMIAGICTGIAEYFNMDVTVVRLIWVLSTLASGGLPIAIYILAIFVFPYNLDSKHYEAKGEKT